MYTQSNIISAPLIYFFIGIKESVVIIVNKNYYSRNQYKAYPDQKSPRKILLWKQVQKDAENVVREIYACL